MSDTWDEDTPAAAPEARDTAVDQCYANVEAWVTGWLTQLYRRHTNTKRSGVELAWCPRWWDHAEAIDRLESMWRAWEAARVSEDPTATAHWWLTIGDPMLAILLDADAGPFSGCRRDGHQKPPALAIEASPPGWWGSTVNGHQKPPALAIEASPPGWWGSTVNSSQRDA
jgi:hypothetical protein